jgi:hypothetical protein
MNKSGTAAVLLALLPIAAQGTLVTQIVPVRELRAIHAPQEIENDPAEKDPCVVADKTLYALESAIVETEARSWAYRMRQPEFSMRRLSRQPGAEITHPEIKTLFEERLAFWNRMRFISQPPLPDLKRVENITKNIRLVKALQGREGALKCSEMRPK